MYSSHGMEVEAKKVTLIHPQVNVWSGFDVVVEHKSESSSLEIDSETKTAILRRCLYAWKCKTAILKEKREIKRIKTEQRAKIDTLVKALKKCQKDEDAEVSAKNRPSSAKSLQGNNSTKTKTTPENYKNRFEAQKVAISRLTTQLEQKNRLIEDLKLGILTKEHLPGNKIDIHEIFKDCSVKVRLKIPPPVEFNEEFMVKTQKAPKILQEMEARALQRALRHDAILQRKRHLDDTRKRLLAEALENKRLQDEEERKINLEKIKERRKKEFELQRIRSANKTAFLLKWQKAVDFHHWKLLKKSLKKLREYKNENKRNLSNSKAHYRKKMLEKSMKNWLDFLEAQYSDKYMLADAVFAQNILCKVLKQWKMLRIERIKLMQVAEDFYDYQLQSKTFIHWHKYVCLEYIAVEKKTRIAEAHYAKKLVFQSFHQWKSLPAVLQLEKAKEEKKRKWREKVWEVLPDYRPPEDF